MALLIVPLIGILGNVAGEILKYQHQHLGNSQATWLTITNYTNDELKIKVSEVDNFDWDGHSRPDHGGGEGFQDAVIAPHSGVKRRQEINAKSRTAMSTMKFSVHGQERFGFRVDEWNAMYDEDRQVAEHDLDHGYHMKVHGGKRNLYIDISKK